MSKKMDELRDMLCDELWRVKKQACKDGAELTPQELEVIDKLTHSIKSIDTITAMEESYEEDSDNGYSERRSRSSYGSYDNGSSYARGRGRYARRDSMGRYSRDNYSRDNYSRNSYRSDGYSREDAKDELLEHLDEIMNTARDEKTRQMIKNWKFQIEESV